MAASSIFRVCIRASLVASLMSVLCGGALAHSGLARSVPPAGSVVEAPKEIVLFFTEKLEPKFSSIEVRDAKGVAMQAGPAVLAPDNSGRLSVALKPLPPGTYQVIWRVLSVDTHRTNGSFRFRVKP